MAIPKKVLLIGAAVAAGAYYLLGSKDANAKPAATKPPQGDGGVTVPPDVLPTVPGVQPIHTPQVTITPPNPDDVQGHDPITYGPGNQTPAKPTTGGQITVQTPAGNLQLPSSVTVPTPTGNVTVTVPTTTTTTTTPAQTTTTPPVVTPAVVVVPPLIHEETKPDQDPFGTVALAQKMVAIEPSAAWKTAFADEIKQWQVRKGLTADGKFGPTAQLVMAQEVGILPVIRYWPKALAREQLAAAVEKQRQALRAVAKTFAASNPAHAKALDLSASYEAGQGFPVKPSALDPQGRAWQAEQLKISLGGS